MLAVMRRMALGRKFIDDLLDGGRDLSRVANGGRKSWSSALENLGGEFRGFD
jgi:hypothetical protein